MMGECRSCRHFRHGVALASGIVQADCLLDNNAPDRKSLYPSTPACELFERRPDGKEWRWGELRRILES